MSEENSNLPTIELFLKSSPVDPQDKGPCPISQKWFMAYYSLVENHFINLRVTPVDLKNPSQEYLKLNVGKHLPVAVVIDGKHPKTGEDMKDLIADNDDEIESLMDRFKCPGLELGASAFKVTEDLFRNFNAYLQTNNPGNMLANLTSLNDFIENRSNKYLQGDHISYVDCVVMPKLQHLRVACHEFKSFEIPSELKGLWRYFETMYDTKGFVLSCPCDRDIIIHYSEKTNPRPKSSFLLRDNDVTSTVPEEVRSHKA